MAQFLLARCARNIFLLNSGDRPHTTGHSIDGIGALLKVCFGDKLKLYTHRPVSSVQGTCMINFLRRVSGVHFAYVDELCSVQSFVARIMIWCAFTSKCTWPHLFFLLHHSLHCSHTYTTPHDPVASVQGTRVISFLRRISRARFASVGELRRAQPFVATKKIWSPSQPA